jgi:hypothetical protein
MTTPGDGQPVPATQALNRFGLVIEQQRSPTNSNLRALCHGVQQRTQRARRDHGVIVEQPDKRTFRIGQRQGDADIIAAGKAEIFACGHHADARGRSRCGLIAPKHSQAGIEPTGPGQFSPDLRRPQTALFLPQPGREVFDRVICGAIVADRDAEAVVRHAQQAFHAFKRVLPAIPVYEDDVD